VTFAAVWKSLSSIGRKVRTGIELLQLGERHPGDFPAAIGCAIDGRIVMHDCDSVGSHPDVELDRVGSRSYRLRERLDGVLRRVRPISAVTDDRPGFRFEENVHGGEKVTGRQPLSGAAPCLENQLKRELKPCDDQSTNLASQGELPVNVVEDIRAVHRNQSPSQESGSI
jgi:hypothetical protein